MKMKTDEVIRIAIESIPSVDQTLIDILSAMLTPIIGILALIIAYQQFNINKQRLRHETYDRRLAVFKSVQKHLVSIVSDNKTTTQQCVEFYSDASEAAFLFDSTVLDGVEVIYKKSIDLASCEEKLFPADGSPGLQDVAERAAVAKEKENLINWHQEQLKLSKEYFREKLGLDNI